MKQHANKKQQKEKPPTRSMGGSTNFLEKQ